MAMERIMLISAFTYLPFLLMAVVQTGRMCWKTKAVRTKMWRPAWFFSLLTTSFLLRVVWCLLRWRNSNDFGDHIVNRFALLAFFAGFVVYVLGWAEVLDKQWMPLLTRLAIIGNIAFVVLVFATSVVADRLSGDARKNVYDGNLVVIVLMHLVLALVFAVLGHKLRRRLLLVFERTHSPIATATARRILVATTILVACFAMRSVFWMWEPLTGKDLGEHNQTLNDIVYPWLYYQVPEIIPGVAMMVLLAPKRTTSNSARNLSSNNSSANPASSSRHAAAGAGMGGKRCCRCWCTRTADKELQVQTNPVGFHAFNTP